MSTASVFPHARRARAFVAREVAATRRVVIKVLPDELATRIDTERFGREIELAASIRHPQIVPLLSAGASGSLLYYTMPFLAAESLRHWRDASGGKLPIREALRIGADIAGALQAAHEQGFVHRDVRPENVFLTGGHAVVTDVGAARAVCRSLLPRGVEQRVTDDGSALDAHAPPHPCWLVGTPSYMSPEQTTSATNLDGRSDVYALGCILYEMLTGTRPFSGTRGRAAAWAPNRSSRTATATAQRYPALARPHRHEGARDQSRGALSDGRGASASADGRAGAPCPMAETPAQRLLSCRVSRSG